MPQGNENLNSNPFFLRLAGLGKRYFVQTPWWLKKIYSSYTWDIKTTEKSLFLTFDDGPHPIATPFVLDHLKKHNARGTFFCLGNNVVQYPEIYSRIIREGHVVGNHSHTHPNGWKTDDNNYMDDITTAKKFIQSELFRPPYGRIKTSQAKKLKALLGNGSKIIMWSILSGDFDEKISKQQCLLNVIRNGKPGSIVVFHDSQKAFPRMAYTLPLVLKNFEEKGYDFRAIK
jgi:peptidoglycan-N-acetylglucosamine deacetylase